MRSTVTNFVLCLVFLGGTCMALCKGALPGQIPHGANELILLREQTVAHTVIV
jgi:hypothetical protein